MRRLIIVLLILGGTNAVSVGQNVVLQPLELKKLMPERIPGYYDDGDTRSTLIKLGNIRYTLCEKKVNRTTRNIKILLFDYKEAPIMYRQAMRRWNNDSIVSDSIIQRSISIGNCNGWESFNKQAKTAQIFLGICDRFFLMLSGEDVELDQLQQVVQLFQLESFPK